ncbi:MAG: hypothetical protein GC168_10510 [Candidatus Hydrogenedens sp.]|nr:hypothetical protein [Candidatus Hydrogenedens sp.]
MPSSLREAIDFLERLSRYDGPWRALRLEGPLLARRVSELRERAEHLHDVLVVAMVGGSGVGKSTFLNALAGDTLAKTSPYRPCTTHPTVYAPPGVRLPFEGWTHTTGSALEHLVIVDTPDSDSIALEHRERAVEVLRQADLVMICGSMEKYLDEATWSLLRPLREERAFVCIETKAGPDESIRAHWLGRLEEQGFQVDRYFRVNALKTYDRKLRSGAPEPEEYDFPALEQYLQEELTAERIERIKRSNVSGLLRKTSGRLAEIAGGAEPVIDSLEARFEAAERELAKTSFAVVEERLFKENHLWSFALGREVGLRAKGIVGTAGRALEAMRTLPARLGSWLPGLRRSDTGKHAAGLMAAEPLFAEDLDAATGEIVSLYQRQRSAITLDLARSGLTEHEVDATTHAFEEALNARVSQVLRGPARDAVVRRARMLTGWPVTLLCDVPLAALILFSAYRMVDAYFFGADLPAQFISLSIMVLLLALAVELAAMGIAARVMAWSARRQALQSLRVAFLSPGLAFQNERAVLDGIRTQIDLIKRIARAVV